MKFTNSDSVGEEIDVPAYWGTETAVVMTFFHYWIIVLEQRADSEVYIQTLNHLYIPRSFPIKNTISQEIKR